MEQQLQLLGRSVHPLAVHQQLIGIQIDDQLVKGQLLLPGLLLHTGAAQDSVNPGQHLFHLKGLDNVIIGPLFQAGHLVLRLPLGGEHNHRSLVVFPNFFQHRPAVHDRQHDIQQHQVGPESSEQLYALAAVLGDQALKALFFQIEVEQFSNVGVILDDQDFFGHKQHLIFLSVGVRIARPTQSWIQGVRTMSAPTDDSSLL